MAITGSWKAGRNGDTITYFGPNQGNGYNPVHAIRGDDGRNISVNPLPGMEDSGILAEYADNPFVDAEEYEENPNYGAGAQTGTDERAPWGSEDANKFRVGSRQRWPSWGPKQNGVPGGAGIRAVNRGANNTVHMKVTPIEDVAQGWVNKDHYELPSDADMPDDSQIFMQTSRVQRDKVRAGSQASGTASEYCAPIASRIPGARIRHFSGGHRHYEMAPKEQNTVLRAFWSRTAGVADASLMAPNSMYVTQSRIRTPPARPDQGDTIDPNSASPSYDVVNGYVPEDQVW